MTLIDNSKIFLKGVFGDATVEVAANTSLKAGTILTVDSSNKIVAYTSTAEGTLGYILAQDIINTNTSAATEIVGVKVFECGEVDKTKLILASSSDTLTSTLIAKLKAAGIICCNVQEETKKELV